MARSIKIILASIILADIFCYVDIELKVKRQKQNSAFMIPIQVNSKTHYVPISLSNQPEFINIKSGKGQSDKHIQGLVSVFHVDNWKEDNWKGTLKQALLLFQNRFNYQIKFNLQTLIDKSSEAKSQVVTFGPNLSKNKFYQLLKKNCEYIENDVISFYVDDDGFSRVQIGGLQHGYSHQGINGIRFYQVQSGQGQSWKLPIHSINLGRKIFQELQVFNIKSSDCFAKISLQSRGITIWKEYGFKIEQVLDTKRANCKFLQSNYLSCTNMPEQQLKNSFLQLQLQKNLKLNISLKDLIQTEQKSREKGNQILFSIRLTQNQNQMEIGEVLLKYLYISLDLQSRKIKYSLINHKSRIFGVEIETFLIYILLFTAISLAFMMALLAYMLKRPKGYKKLHSWTK